MADLLHVRKFVIFLAIQKANIFAALSDIEYGKQTEIYHLSELVLMWGLLGFFSF